MLRLRLRGGRGRPIIRAQDLHCKRYALAADVNAGARDHAHPATPLLVSAEGADRRVPDHLSVRAFPPAEDHDLSLPSPLLLLPDVAPAVTSAAFSGVAMISSMTP